ncbi:FKBP-type peptidyl-prolyl cis-trans isomerase [Veronia pacifica]|uniref:Peptidyl-prolyl cis-trans isomerase n=1 Tax=Veronia pacifica TaxID=1080227 RepID=A0A1C3EJW9_9GAMM|nr:peptidylprolyl isomerase [Veronia pacifica]ODA33525.1 peptidylprolyl isomerase [Veronia pacifica]
MIEKDKVVVIEYTVQDLDGAVINSNESDEPMAFIFGAGQVIPGLETGLAGKAAGDAFDVRLEVEEAYGPRVEELVQEVQRAAFQGVDNIEEGMVFTANGPKGDIQVTVVSVTDDKVVVDGNHPLAGKGLHFVGKVVEVRDATDEELSHGHAH